MPSTLRAVIGISKSVYVVPSGYAVVVMLKIRSSIAPAAVGGEKRSRKTYTRTYVSTMKRECFSRPKECWADFSDYFVLKRAFFFNYELIAGFFDGDHRTYENSFVFAILTVVPACQNQTRARFPTHAVYRYDTKIARSGGGRHNMTREINNIREKMNKNEYKRPLFFFIAYSVVLYTTNKKTDACGHGCT